MRSMVSVVCIGLLLTASAPFAFGQMEPGGGGAPMLQDKGAKEITPEQFSEMKGRMLKMLEERKARLEQEKACVEASKSREELRKCRPEPPMGRGQFRGGPRGQQQPMAPVEGGK